jgi:hypothetical protein
VLLPSYLRSESAKPQLRIGLLLDNNSLPSSFAEIVDHILACNFARLELLVYNADEIGSAPAPHRSLPVRILRLLRDARRRRAFLFRLYQRYDQRNAGPHNPEAMVNCAARLAPFESISVRPVRTRFVDRFPPDVIECIREHQLDVLLRFGFRILRGDILTAARYGVWSYHHDNSEFYRGGPSCFWELYEANPITGTVLQVLTEELDGGIVLQKGLFATFPGVSRARNCLQPYWGASTFVIQKLHELHQHGWGYVESRALPAVQYHGRKKLYTEPSNKEMIRWLGPLILRKAIRRRRPTIDHWRLAIRTAGQLEASPRARPDLSGFRLVESPKGHFYADPFLIQHARTTWLFFEDYDYDAGRGSIACAEVRGGELGQSVPVLEKPYHLSYPCLFRSGGEIYMVPESATNGTVDLYLCTRFPDQWVFKKQLLAQRAVDTTVWVDDDLHWFFVTLQEARGFGTQLWLFYATGPAGEWRSHPANPLSTDVRNSRGAGAILRSNSKLFRPSQDCSGRYGSSFTLNEIVLLDPERYEERPGLTVMPDWAPNLVATHTYSQSGTVEVIDGCTRIAAERVRN